MLVWKIGASYCTTGRRLLLLSCKYFLSPFPLSDENPTIECSQHVSVKMGASGTPSTKYLAGCDSLSARRLSRMSYFFVNVNLLYIQLGFGGVGGARGEGGGVSEYRLMHQCLFLHLIHFLLFLYISDCLRLGDKHTCT